MGEPSGTVLDLGCGEGWSLDRYVNATVVGVDGSLDLLAMAPAEAPRVCGRLPSLGWVRSGSVDGVLCVLVLEHLDALDVFFEESARVVGSAGWLAVVVNHPAYTSPGAGPIVDPADGEITWRWGPYFHETSTSEPAGEHRVTFHHRPTGRILEGAAAAGWCLQRFEERPLGQSAIDSNPALTGQGGFPRLLGLRWLKLPR